MKKISILCLHLGYGGVEQASINLANMLCKTYEVELAVTYKLYDDIPYKLDKRIKVKFLTNLKPNKEMFKSSLKEKKIFRIFKEGFKSAYILYKRTSEMKKYINSCKSDYIISTRIIYTKLLSESKVNAIKMAQEHCHHNNNTKYITQLKKACKNINYLILVSKELKEFYEKQSFSNSVKFVYIPNSLDNIKTKKSNLKNKKIISVGRLSTEKGYLDLIDVFSQVHKNNPSWELDIIGDGPEREKIEEKIFNEKLKEVVHLHGFQNKDYIYKKLSESAIYVMCSHEESFGIVLLEAGTVGLPLVAYDSAQGAKEIIENGKNGFFIKDRNQQQMIKKIEKLISNQALREELAGKAVLTSQKYSFENVKKKWIIFFKNLEE